MSTSDIASALVLAFGSTVIGLLACLEWAGHTKPLDADKSNALAGFLFGLPAGVVWTGFLLIVIDRLSRVPA